MNAANRPESPLRVVRKPDPSGSTLDSDAPTLKRSSPGESPPASSSSPRPDRRSAL